MAAGFEFEIVVPDVAEESGSHLTPRELTGWNAVRKGLVVARRHRDRIVLAADTVVALGNQIIGKPNDMVDAGRILRQLSGRTHLVFSSVFVGHLAIARWKLFCEVTEVTFRRLDRAEIRDYLAEIEPLDKAGAYAAQGDGAKIIARIKGSYSNVVGLPMESVVAALRQFGIRPRRTG